MASENGIMHAFATLAGLLLPVPKAWLGDTETDCPRRRATARGWAIALADVPDEAVVSACVRYAQEPKAAGAFVKTWPQLDDVRRLAGGSGSSLVGVPSLALGRLIDVAHVHSNKLPLTPGEPEPYRLATWPAEEQVRWSCLLAAGGPAVVRTGGHEVRRVFLATYERAITDDRTRWDDPSSARRRERAALLHRRHPDPWHRRADAARAWVEVVEALAGHEHDPALPSDPDRFRLSDDAADEAALDAALRAVGGIHRLRALEFHNADGTDSMAFASARKAATDAYDAVSRRERGRIADDRVRALLAVAGDRMAVEAASTRPALTVHDGGVP